MTPKEALLDDLEAAGTRGLRRAQLRESPIYGKTYGLLLDALRHDDHVLTLHESRYKRGAWWRVVLTYKAPPRAAVDEGPEQIALAVGGSAPPVSALLGLDDAA